MSLSRRCARSGATRIACAYRRWSSLGTTRHGLRRMPSETPVEYLRRILLGLTARVDAVQRLTELFEEAKFSRHEIDAPMKHEAIDALRAIRADLQEDRVEDGQP